MSISSMKISQHTLTILPKISILAGLLWAPLGQAASLPPHGHLPHTKETPHPMTTNTLGEFIKERRRSLEMSQRELAERIGLKTASHLCEVETGTRPLAEEYLPRMAEALGVPLSELQCHDPRAPFAEARELFAKSPEYIRALHRVVQKAKAEQLPAKEILRRIDTPAPDATGATPGRAPAPDTTKPEI
jgi:transcriptional regulator with XRE-family HTH domain